MIYSVGIGVIQRPRKGHAGLYHGFDVRESLVIAATVSSFVVEDYGSITSAPDWGSVVERAGKYLRDV